MPWALSRWATMSPRDAGLVAEDGAVDVVAGGRGSDLHLAGLLGDVFALGKDRALVALDLRSGMPGKLGHLRGRGAAADPGLDVARGHGNGRGAAPKRPSPTSGWRRPKCFIDRQLEHLAAGAAQQEMLPVVVDAYKP